MSALVRAELLALRTVRLPGWLLLATLALVSLGVCVRVLTVDRLAAGGELDTSGLFRLALSSASAGTTTVLVLGILVLTQEFRFGTATPSFLVTPRRERVLLAKLAAVSVVGALYAAVCVLWAVALTVALMRLRGLEVVLAGPLVQTVLGSVLAVVLHGPLGLAVGALVRNQVGAVVGALASTSVVEGLLVALLPEVGRWLPGGASSAVLSLGQGAAARGDLLPPWAGALVLLGQALALSVLAARLTLRRDLS